MRDHFKPQNLPVKLLDIHTDATNSTPLRSCATQKLKLSLKTVQEYCARLKQKLRVANRNQLIRIAVLWRAGVAEIVVRGVRAGE
jgi:hypothetical protein